MSWLVPRFRGAVALSLALLLTPSAADAALGSSPDAELARSARLETVLQLALARNPGLAEQRARARAAAAGGQAASRLPDLEAKYEQWGVPLAHPAALDRANTLMFGVRQSLPPWGSLAARERAAAEEVASADGLTRARRQELAAQVRRAFAAYAGADQELRLHREHVGLMARVLELGRLNQRTGHGSLSDVLRVELELTRLHTDVARLEQQQRSARALLNTLMDRAPDAPLGPPEDVSAPPSSLDVGALEHGLDTNRPEIAAATHAVRRGEALRDGADAAARFPNVMVGLDYWYMPAFPDFHHAYGAMVGINLPWLAPRHRDEQREAEAMVEAERHALAATRNTIRYELRDAAARVDSARQSFTIIDRDLLAQARRSVEATQAGYAAGQADAAALLEALRMYLQVQIERVHALTELASSQADLERAAGTLAAQDQGEKGRR